jgi:hypothetical protein
VKQVSPAVALVKIDRKPQTSVFTLSVNGTMTQREDTVRGVRLGLSFPPTQTFGMLYSGRGVQLKIDELGNRLEITGEQNIPATLAGSPLMFLDPLPPDGQTRWETSQQTTYVEKADRRDDPFSRYRYLPSSPFRPRADEVPGKTYPAVEHVTYSLIKTEGDLVTISKQYELKTQDKPPTLHMTGSGTIEFDHKAGLPKSMTYTGNLAVTVKEVTVRMPLQVSYRLSDVREAGGVNRPTSPSRLSPPTESPLPATPAKPAPKEISDAELTQALADLQDASKRPAALTRLAEAVVIEARRGEVTKAIGPLLADESSQLRAVAILGAWGASEDQIPALLKLLSHSEVEVRRETIVLLGKLKDSRAADPLAERLTRLSDRFAAAEALRSLGPAGCSSLSSTRMCSRAARPAASWRISARPTASWLCPSTPRAGTWA